MVKILRKYADDLLGGVFHCFTGNEIEARELLSFDRFVLGIGGVLTFKKSHLPEVLPAAVPLDRIVLETDSPYMAPVPHRGRRNESAFVVHVLQKLAEAYRLPVEVVADNTNANVVRVFGVV
jgi:TatD DNase family protein